VIRVLGPLQVEGLRTTVRRRALTRLLVALTVTGRPVGVEELRDLIALDPDKPVGVSDVHSFASKLRAHLPAGVLPPIPAGTTGYQLTPDVQVD
jgi:DNA-binding SARP family transcriptional activator